MSVNRRRLRQRRRKQKGGVLPLAAAIPALIAVGKAVGLGAAGRAASYVGKNPYKPCLRKRRNADFNSSREAT